MDYQDMSIKTIGGLISDACISSNETCYAMWAGSLRSDRVEWCVEVQRGNMTPEEVAKEHEHEVDDN